MSARIARALLLSGVIGSAMGKPIEREVTTELTTTTETLTQPTPEIDTGRVNALPFEDDKPEANPPAAIPTPGSEDLTVNSGSASEGLVPQIVDQPVPSAHVLDPLTYYNGIGDEADPGLYDTEDFYWGDGTRWAKLSCQTDENMKMLNMARLRNMVSSLDCSKDWAVTVNFNDQESLESARNAWAWSHHTDQNYVVTVLDGAECGGEDGRRQFLAFDISYDEDNLEATMMGWNVPWESVATKANVTVRSTYPETPGQVKRQSGGTLDLSQRFDTTIFNREIAPNARLNLECADCSSSGSLDFEANFDVSFIPPSVDVNVEVTTRNDVGLDLGFELSVDADLAEGVNLDGVRLLNVPLTPINLPVVGSLGPSLSVIVNGNIGSVSASATAGFGGSLSFANDRTLRLIGDSDDLEPSFNFDDPTLSGRVELSASVAANLVLAFEASVPVVNIGVSAGVALRAPSIEASASVETSTEGVCGTSDPFGVSFVGDIAAEVLLFGGLGTPEEFPNELSVFRVDQPLFDVCLPFGGEDEGEGEGEGDGEGDGGDGGDEVDETAAPEGINGNANGAPRRGTLTLSSPDGSTPWFFASSAEGIRLEALEDGQRITGITLDEQDGERVTCSFTVDEQDSCADPFANTVITEIGDPDDFADADGTSFCVFCSVVPE